MRARASRSRTLSGHVAMPFTITPERGSFAPRRDALARAPEGPEQRMTKPRAHGLRDAASPAFPMGKHGGLSAPYALEILRSRNEGDAPRGPCARTVGEDLGHTNAAPPTSRRGIGPPLG